MLKQVEAICLEINVPFDKSEYQLPERPIVLNEQPEEDEEEMRVVSQERTRRQSTVSQKTEEEAAEDKQEEQEEVDKNNRGSNPQRLLIDANTPSMKVITSSDNVTVFNRKKPAHQKRISVVRPPTPPLSMPGQFCFIF